MLLFSSALTILVIHALDISKSAITVASVSYYSLLAVIEIVLTLKSLTLRQVVGVTGLILTKLDGSARGGCVVFS